jgi:hypothetical protein
MKTNWKNAAVALVLAASVLGPTAAIADRDDYRGYHDWDHHRGWHHHWDNRVYFTGPRGYYEPGPIYYNGYYPAYVPPPAAYYAPLEPGISVTIPIR